MTEDNSSSSGYVDKKQPTFYIPHGGGPCFFMEGMGPAGTWDGMGNWLKALSKAVPQKPTALLVVSAHWEEPKVTVNTAAEPDLFYDYYGFPPHTYEIKYPALGAPVVAKQIIELLHEKGIETSTDSKRGLDHGVFIPFKLIYPAADIPIVQLSLKEGLDPAFHIGVGKALAPLREQGVLIVGSGMSYHNLRSFGSGDSGPHSAHFDQWLDQSITGQAEAVRSEKLIGWESAPSARAAHPREEHLLPLMVVAGAAGADVGRRTYNEKVMGMAISAYQF